MRWHAVKLALLVALLLGAATSADSPSKSAAPERDRRKDYAAFLALPAAQQERIRGLVRDLNQEDPETQGRLLQVMQRYVVWLDRLSAGDRQHVEQAADLTERLARIRKLREKQWIATLSRPDRERLDRVAQRKEQDQARRIALWAAARLIEQGSVPGVPVFPLPLLEERQRALVDIRRREQQHELELQLALAQGPERAEAMQRELNRIRGAFKDKLQQLTPEDRQFVNQLTSDPTIGEMHRLVELAKRYDVPLPEARRQPLLAPGLPRLGPDKLLEFVRDHFSEEVQKNYEDRLRADPKTRSRAVAELTNLYWNTHPQELREYRRLEREKKAKEAKPGKK